MIKGFYPKQKAFIRIQDAINNTGERDYAKEEEWHNQMLDVGFQYDSTYDFYYSSEGALMSPYQVSIESLLKCPLFNGCKELGYEIVYGNPTPQGLKYGFERAFYCKNYEEVINKNIMLGQATNQKNVKKLKR